MESKWNQDLEKESAELILDAMKASAKKCYKKVMGKSQGRSGPAWELGMGAFDKEKT